MIELNFNYKDLFRAARLGFSIQRIWINFLGLAMGYALYLIFTYLSFLLAGETFLAMWDRFGLFPCLFAVGGPWYSFVVYILGLLLLVSFILLTGTAVSRAVYMNLKGETFYSWKEAFQFAFKKWMSVLGAPVAIIGIIAFFVVGALVMGLIGRIPYIGELLTAAMTLFYMGSGLFVFFLILVLGVALCFVPSIIATTNEDGFEAVFQSFSIATGQPWRIVAYGVVVSVIELLAFVILAFSVKKAWLIFSGLFGFAMGDKFMQIGQQALYYAQYTLAVTRNWMDYIFSDYAGAFYFVRDFVPVVNMGVWAKICSYIFAIFMLTTGGLVVSYACATGNAGLTLMYLVMRKKHDNENLLERKEETEEEEKKEEESAPESKEGESKAEETKETKEPEGSEVKKKNSKKKKE